MVSVKKEHKASNKEEVSTKKLLFAGTIAGLFLFAACSFQQVGLQYTTAGKSGFITGLYIFFVPLIGLFFGQKTGSATWIGAMVALIGLYLLSIKDDFSFAEGDLLTANLCYFFCSPCFSYRLFS